MEAFPVQCFSFQGLLFCSPDATSSIVEVLDLRNHGLLEKCKTEIAPEIIEIRRSLIAKGLAIADHVNESCFVTSSSNDTSFGKRIL
jgi:hypothetical protein